MCILVTTVLASTQLLHSVYRFLELLDNRQVCEVVDSWSVSHFVRQTCRLYSVSVEIVVATLSLNEPLLTERRT